MPTRHVTAALSLALALATPAHAQDDDRVADLEARLIARESRIRALEEQLRRRTADEPTSPAPHFVAPADPLPTVKLRGRLQVDALVVHNGAGAAPTGTQLRRLYLGAQGVLAPGLRYQAEADFAGNRVAIQDALVAYRASPSTDIAAGFFKPPNTADEMTSDVSTLFLERSAFAGTLAPGRRVGLAVYHARTGWGLRAGLFGDRADAAPDGADEGWLASARAHADLLPGDDTFHVAASAYYSRTGGDRLVSLSQRPEANRAPAVLATGPFAASHSSFVGGELGYGHGPVTVQIEGGASRHSGPVADPLFWGWSAQLGWRLTGEERPYDGRSGLFGRVAPRRGINDGGPGAVDAGLRVTHVDLEDDTMLGGRLTTYGAVLNWYPITRLRIAGNIIHAVSAGAGEAKTSQTLVTLRGGIDW